MCLARMLIFAIRIQDPVKGFPALVHCLAQVTAHEPKPIAIGHNLIRPIHCGHGIFAIHDGRDRAFQQDIIHTRAVATANSAIWINLNGNMQTVFLQYHLDQSTAIVCVHPDILGWIRKGGDKRVLHNLIACNICMRAAGQGRDLIQISFGPVNHTGAARCIIASAAGQVSQSIRAIERIVKAAPTGIGRVQSIARIHDRHHKLRAGRCCNFWIYILSCHRKTYWLRHQIPNLFQKTLIGLSVMSLTAARDVPFVNFALNICALRQKIAIFWSQFMRQFRQAIPKLSGADRQPIQSVRLDEII